MSNTKKHMRVVFVFVFVVGFLYVLYVLDELTIRDGFDKV